MDELLRRGLARFKGLVAGRSRPRSLAEKDLPALQRQLQECVDGLGGEVSARQRAARLAATYLSLDDSGRRTMLRLIATAFGPDAEKVASTHAAWQQALGTNAAWDAEARLRDALGSRRTRILTHFSSMPDGVKFLVDLRADLIRYARSDPALAALDRELEAQLVSWFDVGFLELVRITWQSPAALLEKLIRYEAVHAIGSWEDLKNRLDSDRRCYAFFHPRMPLEPLIFVEVALVDEIAANVQALLDPDAPVFDAEHANTAIFYSINNTQTGLRGVSFGNFLLKRVVEDLKRDYPRLKTFSTLSPIPGLTAWAGEHSDLVEESIGESDWRRLKAAGVPATDGKGLLAWLSSDREWAARPATARALRDPLQRVAARYLVEGRRGDRPADPVARFHLGNGARIERLNWLGDTADKGLAQSWGMMVNYLYDPDRIEANVEAFMAAKPPDASASLRRMARH
ncbi:MAG: malonyl-CoA decarboxylase [Zoogloeaceae bacterium]|nr:malonyl-CoA decarboxylase [Zoogloeaceae bacterium]